MDLKLQIQTPDPSRRKLSICKTPERVPKIGRLRQGKSSKMNDRARSSTALPYLVSAKTQPHMTITGSDKRYSSSKDSVGEQSQENADSSCSQNLSSSISDDAANFEFRDIPALREANLNPSLLDTFAQKEEQPSAQREVLEKHAKVFGYIRIPAVLIQARKMQILKLQSQKTSNQVQALDDQIKEAQRILQQLKKPTKSGRDNSQAILSIQGHLQDLNMKRMASLRLMDKPMVTIVDHALCDVLYAQSIYGGSGHLRRAKNLKLMEISEKGRSSKRKPAFTFSPENTLYKRWRWVIVTGCLYSIIIYPYYLLIGFPSQSIDLWVLEALFLIDISVSFFKQRMEEGGEIKAEPLEETANHYLNNGFAFDFIAFLPLGWIFGFINERFGFLWTLKTLRVGQLSFYLRDHVLLPIVHGYINRKQAQALRDERTRHDMTEDHIFQAQKIHLANLTRILRLILQMLFITYFMGLIWSCFSRIFILGPCSFYEEWVSSESEDFSPVLLSAYFALTTLSTVGFGDLYPLSSVERFVGSMSLLFGVAIFSYTMGELMEMIKKVDSLKGSFSQEDQLDQFFLLLQKFNHGQPIKKHVQEEILAFMELKWAEDKNNFLSEEMGQQLFSQLPSDCKVQIFKDFVFDDFLFKFRRFFSFRAKSTHASESLNPHIRKVRQLIQSMNKVRLMLTAARQGRTSSVKHIRVTASSAKSEEPFRKKGFLGKSTFEFPFLTFRDDIYAQFMIQLMSSLEVRSYAPHRSLVKELDEATEMLFVMEGRYNVGYEIDNKSIMRRQFGPSTMIGCFNLCFSCRFLFAYMSSQSGLKGLAIRKKNWSRLLSSFPKFDRQIKQKSFSTYFQQIYYPLQKLREQDFQLLKSRKGLCKTRGGKENESVRAYWREIKKEMSSLEETSRSVAKIQWLFALIDKKLNAALQMCLQSFSRTERLQQVFWDRLRRAEHAPKTPALREKVLQFTELVSASVYGGLNDKVSPQVQLRIDTSSLLQITNTVALMKQRLKASLEGEPPAKEENQAELIHIEDQWIVEDVEASPNEIYLNQADMMVDAVSSSAEKKEEIILNESSEQLLTGGLSRQPFWKSQSAWSRKKTQASNLYFASEQL